jgi:hypothetical protein
LPCGRGRLLALGRTELETILEGESPSSIFLSHLLGFGGATSKQNREGACACPGAGQVGSAGAWRMEMRGTGYPMFGGPLTQGAPCKEVA